MPASLLLITNHCTDRGCPGSSAALRELVETGELSHLDVIHAGFSLQEPRLDRNLRVVQAVAASRADIVLVLSLKDAITDMEGMSAAIASRPIVYWEGDPWGRGKRVSEAMKYWLEYSQTVFSVGGHPQSDLLRSLGARDVRLVPHTYDHLLFAESERSFSWNPVADRLGFIGSNLMRFPLVSGLPGSWQRFTLVRRLRQSSPGFLLAGPGWPPHWSKGAIEFAEQAGFLRSCQIVANWDHFPRTRDYTSDRLAITMVTGRAQVSTRHPGMAWLPGPDSGLFLVDDVDSAVTNALGLARLKDAELSQLGEQAHLWARHRLSHRNAYRYMVASIVDEVDPPEQTPWDRLPVA